MPFLHSHNLEVHSKRCTQRSLCKAKTSKHTLSIAFWEVLDCSSWKPIKRFVKRLVSSLAATCLFEEALFAFLCFFLCCPMLSYELETLLASNRPDCSWAKASAKICRICQALVMAHVLRDCDAHLTGPDQKKALVGS